MSFFKLLDFRQLKILIISEPQDNDSNIVKQTKSLLKFRDPNNVEMKLDMSGNGMEFLSVAAGVTAKDKRTKDVVNQAAAMKDGNSSCIPRVTSMFYSL